MSDVLSISRGPWSAPIESRLRRLEHLRFASRLGERDPTLWSDDPAHQAVARNRLGWLDSPARMKSELGGLRSFASEVAGEGFTHAILLGMGGSSLAPEVLRLTFGVAPGGLELAVLDDTSPAAVRAMTETHDPARTLFLVSSKSGGTIEVSSFERHFFEWVRSARGDDAGRSFVAITDPDTVLASLAVERGYRRTFTNAADIGGRFSALSYFGLVPGALIGMDLAGLLEAALREAEASRAPRAPGIVLGAALGELAIGGRDKVTLVLSEPIAALGSWVEQLLAESTGKQGRGLVPVTGEPLAAPEVYGSDRVFVAISVAGAAPGTRLDALEAAGHPVLRWTIASREDLGAEFFRWEVATAAAGAVLGVDPFDEPNVAEAKKATQSALARAQAEGSVPWPEPGAEREARDLEAVAARLLELAKPGDFVAALAFFHRTPERRRRLEELAVALRDATRLAVTAGYGPRYLHSTGQLHKGGPDGVFLLLTADERPDAEIPGSPYGFAVLHEAQAAGDCRTLTERGRRVLRAHLSRDVEAGLALLKTKVEARSRRAEGARIP